jgi:hypothetical protein
VIDSQIWSNAEGYARMVHRYKKPGHYLLRGERSDHRAHTAVGHLHVRVGDLESLPERP